MKNNCKLALFIFLLSYVSCNSSPQFGDKPQRENLRDSKLNSVPDLKSLLNDDNNYHFTDKGSFWLLYFVKGDVHFDFTPNWGHAFKGKLDTSKHGIVIYCDSVRSCIYDKNFDLRFPNILSPENEDPFGIIYRDNDSTLTINYYFEDWIKAVNKKEEATIDTLFPSHFKLIDLNSKYKSNRE